MLDCSPPSPRRPQRPATPASRAKKKFAEAARAARPWSDIAHGSDRQEHALNEDRYTLTKVSKVSGDLWLFEARIQVEGHDVSLPVPLRVLWAGDTPVITLDDLALPGLGTFGARIVIHGHQYAGVWTHGDKGAKCSAASNAKKLPKRANPSNC